MLTLNLYRAHEVGHVIRPNVLPAGFVRPKDSYGGFLFRIVREVPGGKLDCFPGGIGVRTVEVVLVADKHTTAELAYAAEVKAAFAAKYPELAGVKPARKPRKK